MVFFNLVLCVIIAFRGVSDIYLIFPSRVDFSEAIGSVAPLVVLIKC